MIVKDEVEWDGETCMKATCKKAKVTWVWDETKPGAWGWKACENCGHVYAGISCPYIPPDIIPSKIPDPTWTHSATVLSDGSIERHSDYKE